MPLPQRAPTPAVRISCTAPSPAGPRSCSCACTAASWGRAWCARCWPPPAPTLETRRVGVVGRRQEGVKLFHSARAGGPAELQLQYLPMHAHACVCLNLCVQTAMMHAPPLCRRSRCSPTCASCATTRCCTGAGTARMRPQAGMPMRRKTPSIQTSQASAGWQDGLA